MGRGRWEGIRGLVRGLRGFMVRSGASDTNGSESDGGKYSLSTCSDARTQGAVDGLMSNFYTQICVEDTDTVIRGPFDTVNMILKLYLETSLVSHHPTAIPHREPLQK